MMLLRKMFTGLGLLGCIGVQAQQLSAGDEPDNSQVKEQANRYLETVVVTARPTATPLSAVAGSVGEVDYETLQLVKHSHINEAADRVAGVWISRGNGQESLPSVRSPVFTGAGSCGAFLMTEDGLPIRPAGFCNVNQLFEINTEQAQRIEIFKGPNSAVYGSNAVHGVINVSSPSVTDEEFGSAAIDLGPHDYRRLFATYNDGEQFRIDAHFDHDGGYKHDSGFDQQKLSLKHRYTANELRVDSYFTATNLNQETAGYLESVNGEEVYKDDDLKKDNNNPEAYRDASSWRAYSRFTLPGVAEGSQMVFTPYLRHSEMEFIQHWIPTTPLEENASDSLGLDGRFLYEVGQAAVVSGFVVEAAKVDVAETQSEPTKFGKFTQGVHYDYNVDISTLAAFSEMDYLVNDMSRFIFGLRYDYQHYDYENNTTTGSSGIYTRPASREDDFGEWSANAGVIVDYVADHQWYVSVSNGFRIPQTAELYRLQGGQPIDDIESEQIISFETGLRGQLGDVFYTVSVFTMDKDNVILRDSNRLYIGDGETSHEGVELSWDYRFAVDYFWRGALTYAEHRYEEIDRALFNSGSGDIEGNIIDSAPRHYGSTQLGRYFHWGLLELELKHLGPYYLDPENSWSYDGHDLLNLRALWHPREDINVSARLLNVLDEDYAERADVTVEGNPANAVPRYFVGEPRSLYLTVEKIW